MRVRFLLVLLILFAFSLLFAAEMMVKQPLSEVPGDLALVQNPVKDMSGRDCALVKISTDLAPFDKIESNQTPVNIVSRIGEVWVYLSPGDRRLYFTKTGYARFIYDIPITLMGNTVYTMTLTGGSTAAALPVSILTTPADAEKWLDGTLLGTGDSFSLARGEYRLEVRKTGFKIYAHTITIDDNNALIKDIQLVEIEPVLFTICSTPTGADIQIDDASNGITDKQVGLFPGTYHLRVSLSGYTPYETDITVTENGANSVSAVLSKTSTTLTIVTEPADAEIYVNSVCETGHSLERGPGAYKIEVRRNGYERSSRMILLEKGKPRVETFKLEPVTGRLTFTVQPLESQVMLSNGDRWTGGKITSLPIGDYELTASCDGYEPKTVKISVNNAKPATIDLTLPKLDKTMKNEDKISHGPPANVSNDMLLIDGGEFLMGSEEAEKDEKPVHHVSVGSFMIGKYEVSQELWINVMGSNPSTFLISGLSAPVDNVLWNDCIEFCNKLSLQEGLASCYSGRGDSVVCDFHANGYRLPTEAEWEFAARGGIQSMGCLYSGGNTIGDVAWYWDNAGGETHIANSKSANELSLFGMSGNVREWCWDWYDPKYYRNSHSANPTGPRVGPMHVYRGGSWFDAADNCRISARNPFPPGSRYTGLRLCRTVK
jgi:formylglycine-generating enzyme